MQTTSEKTAKREGSRAWLNDIPRKACPYRSGPLRDAWLQGWTERDAGQQLEAD